MKDDARIVVVGAGVAGLTLAYRLASAGKQVIVLERDAVAGGLAKSYSYDGYLFDVGPHRFYTDEPAVSSFITEILGDDTLVITRSSAVFMTGRFIEWPLSPAALGAIAPKMLLMAFLDLFRRKREGGAVFDEYIIGQYGETLYRAFFKPYTEKFLGVPCTELSRDWAIAGIDRATIDRTVAVQNLFAIAVSLVRRKEPLEFLYPRSGGISVFADKLRAGIEQNGGRVLLNSPVRGVNLAAGSVTEVSTTSGDYPCTELIWTGSLHGLASCLGCAPPPAEYLSLLLYNYRLSVPCPVRYQWCYFGEEHIPFNRASFTTMFNPGLAPEGGTGLCVEVTCRTGDALWSDPLPREPEIRAALLKIGLIPGEEAIRGVAVERVADAYPVYRTGYREEVDRFIRELPADNITAAGRTGGFWYNNMDNSISEALQLADRLEKKERHHE